jgi:hypothetical protein
MTFLLSEDKALRQKLEDIQVQDQRADFEGKLRKVGVWFGMPDQEIRDQSYPYIIIDMIDVNRDTSREMRGVIEAPQYLLANAEIPANQGRKVDLPIPVNIDYQVTTYARHPRHDRELLSQLLYSKFPIRAGVLDLDDGTSRRLDVVDIAKRDMVEQGKRLFMNAITVRVSSEIAQGTLKQLYRVQKINLSDLYTFDLSI